MPRNHYSFREHWIIPAPRERVYEVISDAKLLPQWWKGVYLESEPLGEGEAQVGSQARVKARGALPYKLNFLLTSTALERGRVIETTTEGDFTGMWRATLSDFASGRWTYVDIDWQVTVEKPLIRFLSPLLKPLFAWNHNWTTPRGEAGLIAYLAAMDQRETVVAERELLTV